MEDPKAVSIEYKILKRQLQRMQLTIGALAGFTCLLVLWHFASVDLSHLFVSKEDKHRFWPDDVDERCIEPRSRVKWDSSVCWGPPQPRVFVINDDLNVHLLHALSEKYQGLIPREAVPDRFKSDEVDPWWFEVCSRSAKFTIEKPTASDGLFHFLIESVPCKAHGCCSLPYVIQPNSTEFVSLRNHFVKNEYIVLKHLIKEPEYILDAGGLGMAPIFFSLLFPQALILRVEPHYLNYRSGVLNGRYFTNIKQVNLGLWNKATTLQMCDNTRVPWGDDWPFSSSRQQAFFTREPKDPPCDIVALDDMRVSTLDKIMAAFNVPRFDLIKMDVEGAEAVIFRHKKTVKALKKAKVFIAETHDATRPGSSKAVRDCYSRWNGFSTFYFDENIVAVRSETFKC